MNARPLKARAFLAKCQIIAKIKNMFQSSYIALNEIINSFSQ